MRHNPGPIFSLACIALIALLAGCASSASSIRFDQSEIKLIPAATMHRVLTPGSGNETVVVKTRELSAPATVKGFQGKDHVVVQDAQGNETTVAIGGITEIDRIYRPGKPETKSKGSHGSAAEQAGEALIYAPLVPVAIVSWPFLRAAGLDAKKNAQDIDKALLLYDGMTRKELRANLGEPAERYQCTSKSSKDRFELWHYGRDKVLRAGQFLFLNPDKGQVYFALEHFPKWAECTLLKE